MDSTFTLIEDYAKTNTKKKRIRSDVVECLKYRDEKWNYIDQMEQYFKCIQNGEEINFEDNSCYGDEKYILKNEKIIVRTDKRKNNWLFFICDDNKFVNYIFEFDIELITEFTEVQLAFNYKNLGNRCRFMIRDNKEAVFEIVEKGKFYKHIFTKEYSLKVKQKNHISIEVKGNNYRFTINNEDILYVKDEKELIKSNKLGIILWNREDDEKIQCTLENIELSEI